MSTPATALVCPHCLGRKTLEGEQFQFEMDGVVHEPIEIEMESTDDAEMSILIVKFELQVDGVGGRLYSLNKDNKRFVYQLNKTRPYAKHDTLSVRVGQKCMGCLGTGTFEIYARRRMMGLVE